MQQQNAGEKTCFATAEINFRYEDVHLNAKRGNTTQKLFALPECMKQLWEYQQKKLGN